MHNASLRSRERAARAVLLYDMISHFVLKYLHHTVEEPTTAVDWLVVRIN